MSYAAHARLSSIIAGLAVLLPALAACTARPPTDAVDVATSEAALGESGTLTFGADFQTTITGTLQKGKTVRVAYDASRLTACRGDQNGHPAWTITGYWKIGGGAVHSFEAGGFSPSGGMEQPVFLLDASGDLELWFQNDSIWGCNAYDSDFGKNYHFAVLPAANEPGWMGNVRDVISRQTCNGGPCESDMQPVSGEILYNTWARQRAAIKAIDFETWKQGVTDFDNADLWEQLDVQVHSRVVGTSAFQAAYVSFDRRTGQNARYATDLGGLDPFAAQTTVTNRSDCPTFALSTPADDGGQYVEATVELYFTVNGAELRPAAGDTFKVRYQTYKGFYAVCLP